VHITDAEKHTPSGSKLEFMSIVWAQVRPAGTAEHTKICIIWSDAKECLKGGVIGQKLGGSAIDKISGRKERLIPIFEHHRCMSKGGQDPSSRYGDACAWHPHFADGCADKTQDGKCHWHENRSGDPHTPHPNRVGPQ
jgi:hypothetical protein